MKYTAQQIKFHLEVNDHLLYLQCLVNKKDRKFQIWKRKPLSIELFTPAVYQQKIEYILNNPVKAGLSKY
ncbi:MAG TPA: transposase, partial [Ferruginibacter sp.]|nr:transposase [Ferruginibacter sp.]